MRIMLAEKRRARFGELVRTYGNTAELSRVLGRSAGYRRPLANRGLRNRR